MVIGHDVGRAVMTVWVKLAYAVCANSFIFCLAPEGVAGSEKSAQAHSAPRLCYALDLSSISLPQGHRC